MPRQLLFFFAVIAFTFALSVSAHAKELEAVRISILGDLSGPTSGLANLAYGRRDYLTYVNDRGGIRGHEIDFNLVDAGEIIPRVLAAYKKEIAIFKPHFLYRWGTGDTKATRQMANTVDKVAGISCSYSEDLLSKEWPYDFIFGPSYEDELEAMLKIAKSEGAKKVAFVGRSIEASQSPLRNIIARNLPAKYGMEVVANVSYPARPTDLTSEMLMLKKSNPDIIIGNEVPIATIALVNAANKVGLDASKFFLGHYVLHDSIIKACGSGADGVRTFQIIPKPSERPDAPVMKEINEYLEKHYVKDLDEWYLMGWVVSKCAVEAITRALDKCNNKIPELFTFRKMIRDELEGLRNFDVGAGMPLINYADHKGFNAGKVMRIVNQKWTPVSGEYYIFGEN